MQLTSRGCECLQAHATNFGSCSLLKVVQKTELGTDIQRARIHSATNTRMIPLRSVRTPACFRHTTATILCRLISVIKNIEAYMLALQRYNRILHSGRVKIQVCFTK